MNKRTMLSLAAGLTAVSLLAACHKSAAPNTAAAMAAMPPPAVTANQPIQREVTDWDEYPGRLEAVDMVEVRAKVGGYLQSVDFKDGAEVKKGDLLFTIDPRQYKAELDHAVAEMQQAKTRFELASNDQARAERLLKGKAISEEEADSRAKNKLETEAAIESARAMAEMAQINLDYTRIMSPIDGRISRKLMTVGNLVNGNQGQATLLTTIVSMDPIYCYFDADEQSILKYQQLARDGHSEGLRDGKMVCEVGLADETGFPHKGTMDFVENRVDPATGTLQVRCVLPNPDRILQPGFFTRVRVPASAKHPALLISDAAVGSDQGQKFVLIVNDKDQVEYRPVKLGPTSDGLRVVREGIGPKDWVIVNGLMSARPGVPVRAARVAAGESPEKMAAAQK